MAAITKPNFMGQRATVASSPRVTHVGVRNLKLQVVGSGGRPVGRAGNARVNRPYKTSRPEEGFNNEHPNAKKAAKMKDKNWRDASGRKGKGLGAYRFTNDYGDINDYSPIFDPTVFSPQGDEYKPGTGGILAWLALFTLIVGVGTYLIYQTSALA